MQALTIYARWIFYGARRSRFANTPIFQAKPRRRKIRIHHRDLFLLALLRYIKTLPCHFYGFNHDIIFYFQLQITCKLIVFNLPVGLASVPSSIFVECPAVAAKSAGRLPIARRETRSCGVGRRDSGAKIHNAAGCASMRDIPDGRRCC